LFVEGNFLVPEVILPKMQQTDLTGKIAGWLALPETAPMVADRIITLLKRFLAASHSVQINEFVQRTVSQQLRRRSNVALVVSDDPKLVSNTTTA
jgi:uncharacterized membrane-anchored protein YjiN (DUF445 family)